MARSCRRDAWDPIAALRADLSNMFASEGARKHPWQLNPYRDWTPRRNTDGKQVVRGMITAFTGITEVD